MCLRLKNGELAIRMLPKVFRVLCALDPRGHAYQKPLLEQMLLLKYHEYTDSPTWYLLKNHFHLFNEEVGEVSLSVLSRLQQPILSKRPDVQHWDNAYKLSKVYQSVDDSVMTSRDKNNTRSKPIKMKNHRVTLRKTHEFLYKLIKSAGRGTFEMLSGTKKVWNSKRYRCDEWQKEESVRRTKTIPLFKRDISALLLQRWRLVRKDTESNWAARNVAGSWPEYGQGLDVEPVVSESEDQEEEGDENQGDEGEPAGEGDDENLFLLPGAGEESEDSDKEEDERRVIQDHEDYMAEFVDPENQNVNQLGFDNSSSEDDESLIAADESNGSSKKVKRLRQ